MVGGRLHNFTEMCRLILIKMYKNWYVAKIVIVVKY